MPDIAGGGVAGVRTDSDERDDPDRVDILPRGWDREGAPAPPPAGYPEQEGVIRLDTTLQIPGVTSPFPVVARAASTYV
jgi:hypothetical protein